MAADLRRLSHSLQPALPQLSYWPDHFTRDMSGSRADCERLLQRALAVHDWAAQGDAKVLFALAGGGGNQAISFDHRGIPLKIH